MRPQAIRADETKSNAVSATREVSPPPFPPLPPPPSDSRLLKVVPGPHQHVREHADDVKNVQRDARRHRPALRRSVLAPLHHGQHVGARDGEVGVLVGKTVARASGGGAGAQAGGRGAGGVGAADEGGVGEGGGGVL
jgi:hypothetical protein